MKTEQRHVDNSQGTEDGSFFGMLALMMGLCLGILLLFFAIPALGAPRGVLVILGVGVLVVATCMQIMRRGHGQ